MTTDVKSDAVLAMSPTAPYRAGALMLLLHRHWFIRLRCGFIAIAGLALVIEHLAWPSSQRPWALVWVLIVIAIVNAVWFAVSRALVSRLEAAESGDAASTRAARLFTNAQIATDLLLLTAIMRYTGGVENPMAVFYLFHMAISAMVLNKWHALLQGVWAVGLYSALGLGELWGWITPHCSFLPALAGGGFYGQPQYVAAAIAVFASGVFGTLFFTLRISARLDERELRLRQAHGALQRSQQAIHDLQQRRSRFMQTAAHQLKSPLAGIQTLAGLIRQDIVPPDALHGTCDKIMQRCRDGIAHVHELLTLARVQETDPRRHEGTPADVGEVVRDLIQRHQPLADVRELTVECHIPEGEDLRARVDPTDLTDCVGNLIENAIKYTEASGKVTICVERSGLEASSGTTSSGAISIAVSDTGMGIEPELLGDGDDAQVSGTVFDAFRRGNNALAAGIPGSGLGLAIVREVVEQAHGRLRVRSRVGEGSTFTVVFPALGTRPIGPAVLNTRSSEIVTETARPRSGAATGAEELNHAG